MVGKLLTNPYYIGIGIPILLIILGAIAKKIVRGKGWRARDFYMGIEFTLAALSSAILYLVELYRSILLQTQYAPNIIYNKALTTALFIPVVFILFMVVLSTHQDWENQVERPRAQFFRLGLFCNFMGSGLLCSFVLIIKGIS